MSSNVGTAQVYEAGDQRNVKQSELNDAERYNEGKPNSHLAQDSKDERTIGNKLASETTKDDEGFKSKQAEQIAKDATLPARAHGNEPSRGAKIDQELREEDEAALKKKGPGDSMPGKH